MKLSKLAELNQVTNNISSRMLWSPGLNHFGLPLLIDFEIGTPHISVNGEIGSGKTQAIKSILAQKLLSIDSVEFDGKRIDPVEVTIISRDDDFRAFDGYGLKSNITHGHPRNDYTTQNLADRALLALSETVVKMTEVAQKIADLNKEDGEVKGFETLQKLAHASNDISMMEPYRILVIDDFGIIINDEDVDLATSGAILSAIERITRVGRDSGIHLILSDNVREEESEPLTFKNLMPTIKTGDILPITLYANRGTKTPLFRGRIGDQGSECGFIQSYPLTDKRIESILFGS